MEEDSIVISTDDLGRRFGRHWALAHVGLELRRGESLLLAGPNGSGKTTLLRLVAGLYRATAGKVRVLGVDPRREPTTCRHGLTMVSHHSFLYERLTALEILRFWSQQQGADESRSVLLELLAQVGLEEFADEQVEGFSAGMRKRLTLLRTGLEAPRLVLWDEPFSSLDPEGRRLLAEWVAEFRSRGVSMMLATHDLDLGARLCDRAVVLERGQMIWSGPADGAAGQLEALR